MDIKDIMQKMGAIVVKETDRYIVFNSICCKPNKHKLYYYKDSGIFYCFLSTCSRSYTLRQLMNKVGRNDLIDIATVPNSQHEYFSLYEKYIKKNDNIIMNEPIDEKILDKFLLKPFYPWILEGINIPIQYIFGIRFDAISNRVVIPKYNENGQLIGLTGRLAYEDSTKPKYLPLIPYKKSIELYGLFRNKETIQKEKIIVVFEGEKSVMKLNKYWNVGVAVEGSYISNEQFKKMIKFGVKEVVIAFDKEYTNENEMYEYRYKLMGICHKFKPYTTVSIILDKENLLGYKDAPIDKGLDVFMYLFKKRERV